MDAQSTKSSRRRFLIASLTIALTCEATAWAAAPPAATHISTRKMCPVCAQKITSALRQFPGVVDARADIASKTFVVVPATGQGLSPRALWDAVERGGEQPIRLVGPSGTFDVKPAF